MSDGPPISDDDLRKLIDAYMSSFPSLFDILGVKAPRGFLVISSKKKEHAVEGMKKLFKTLSELGKLSVPEPDPKKELLRLETASKLLASVVDAPRRTYIAEYYVRYFQEGIDIWGYFGYFRSSGHREQRDEISAIVAKLYERNLVAKAVQFLDEFENTDGIMVVQPMIANLRKHLRYLLKRRQTFERKDLDNQMEIYRLLSGVYEKLIRLVTGFLMILENKEVTYEIIKRSPLASNVQYVAKRSPDLTKDFDITIRNALVHASSMIHFSNSTIDFVDNYNRETLTFKQFHQSCRSLSSLVIAIWVIKGHFFLTDWKGRLAYYRRVKKLASVRGSP